MALLNNLIVDIPNNKEEEEDRNEVLQITANTITEKKPIFTENERERLYKFIIKSSFIKNSPAKTILLYILPDILKSHELLEKVIRDAKKKTTVRDLDMWEFRKIVFDALSDVSTNIEPLTSNIKKDIKSLMNALKEKELIDEEKIENIKVLIKREKLERTKAEHTFTITQAGEVKAYLNKYNEEGTRQAIVITDGVNISNVIITAYNISLQVGDTTNKAKLEQGIREFEGNIYPDNKLIAIDGSKNIVWMRNGKVVPRR